MTFRNVIKNPFLWAFLLGIASLHLVKEMAWRRRSAPEPLVIVPDWTLIDHRGRPLGKSDLHGKVVIADFFFTSCPTICPKLTEAMRDLYQRLKKHGDRLSFLSITVDPVNDTPEALAVFIKDNNLEHKNWYALTGSKEDIYKTVVEKMRIHMGEREEVPEGKGIYDIPHLAHLALFDQNGDLRGLFRPEPVELAALVRAAEFLLER